MTVIAVRAFRPETAPEARGERGTIELALARADQLVESIAARSLSKRILEQRGRLAAACGDAPAASRALEEVLNLYRATGHAERLARELGGTL
jgi:hypothetical protein